MTYNAAEPRSFDEFQEEGLLWLVNRVVFHPRGYALTFHYDNVGDLTGWSIQGDGSEVWTFEEATDDERFAQVKAFFENTPERKPRPFPSEDLATEAVSIKR